LDKSGNAIEIVPALSLPVLPLDKPENNDAAEMSLPTMEAPQLDESGPEHHSKQHPADEPVAGFYANNFA